MGNSRKFAGLIVRVALKCIELLGWPPSDYKRDYRSQTHFPVYQSRLRRIVCLELLQILHFSHLTQNETSFLCQKRGQPQEQMQKNTLPKKCWNEYLGNPCQGKLHFGGQLGRHEINGYIAHLDKLEHFLLTDGKFVIINIAMCHCFGFPTLT